MILIDDQKYFVQRMGAYKHPAKKVHLIAWDESTVYCGRVSIVRLQTHEVDKVTCGRCRLNLEAELKKEKEKNETT